MISTSVWRSRRFLALQTGEARMLYLYLHTTKHGNSAGTFEMPPEMAFLETKIDVDVIRESFIDMRSNGLIRYDEDEQLVQIRGFYKFNAISSRKHLQGPLKVLDGLPDCDVKKLSVCDLAISIHERAVEWRDKISWLIRGESRKQKGDAESLMQARAAFLEIAQEMIKRHRCQSLIFSTEIGLPEKQRIALSEDLLIPLSIQGEGKDQGKGNGEDQDQDQGKDQDQDHPGTAKKRNAALSTPTSSPAEGSRSGRGKVDDQTQRTIAELTAKAKGQ